VSIAWRTQKARVSASLRQGMRIVRARSGISRC
jgi:hypothetical protein